MKYKKNKYRLEFSRGTNNKTTKQTTKNNRPWIDNMEERFDRCLQIFGCNFCRPVHLGSEKSLRVFSTLRETIMLGIFVRISSSAKKSDNPSKTTQMAISFSKKKK